MRYSFFIGNIYLLSPLALSSNVMGLRPSKSVLGRTFHKPTERNLYTQSDFVWSLSITNSHTWGPKEKGQKNWFERTGHDRIQHYLKLTWWLCRTIVERQLVQCLCYPIGCDLTHAYSASRFGLISKEGSVDMTHRDRRPRSSRRKNLLQFQHHCQVLLSCLASAPSWKRTLAETADCRWPAGQNHIASMCS